MHIMHMQPSSMHFVNNFRFFSFQALSYLAYFQFHIHILFGSLLMHYLSNAVYITTTTYIDVHLFLPPTTFA